MYKEIPKDFERRVAYAALRAIAVLALEDNDPDALESLKRLWELGIPQKYMEIIPQIKKLVELGKLP